MISNLHIISSKTSGGAERFCLRLAHALRQDGWETSLLLRHGSILAPHVSSKIQVCQTTMATAWDPWSRWQIARAIRRLKPELIQTYMGRATRLTRLRGHAAVHVARLGGHYRLTGYCHADAWIGNTKGLCDYLIDQGLPRNVFSIFTISSICRRN